MPRPISATISLPALRHNLHVIATQLNEISTRQPRATPKIWAVIKANAYGHGIGNALQAFDAADGLAMLDLNEAVQCRQAGWTKPILLLEGFFEPADIPVCAEYGLTVTLHNREQFDMLELASPGRAIDANIKLNTGMNRLGFSPDAYGRAYAQALVLQQQGILGALGKMSHFARADDDAAVTQAQVQVFNETTAALPGRVSLCNSAGTFLSECWLALPADQEQWVRPGICLYGASPFANRPARQLGLRPAMTLRSQLISVRNIMPGDRVGYGQIFTASEPMKIGVVACGYADGYPRHAPTGTPITVAGARSRVLGRVSMDMLVADLTQAPGAQVGSPVILWGEGGPSVDEVALASDTIGYELLCALAPRVPRTVMP